MTPAAFQAAGAVIVAAVMVQVLVLLVTSFRRYSRESVQQNLALELLETQVDIAKGVFKEVQSSEFSWPGYRKFTVQRKVPEGGGVCSFYLAPHDGKPLPSFKPGQFLTFNLHFQGGGRDAEKEVVRCYSLSDSSGHADYYRVSIKKVPPRGINRISRRAWPRVFSMTPLSKATFSTSRRREETFFWIRPSRARLFSSAAELASRRF